MPPASGGTGTADSTGTQSWTPDFDDTSTGAADQGDTPDEKDDGRGGGRR
jgi:hypothetical protein